MKKLITIILIALLATTAFVACEDEKENNNIINIDGGDGGGTMTDEEQSKYNTPSDQREFEDVDDVVCVMTVNGAANLRTETNLNNSSKAKSVKNGTELKRTGVESQWSRVEYDGVQYYISNSVIVEKEELDGFVATTAKIEITTASINYRYIPNSSVASAVIGSFAKGDIVEVVGFNKDIGQQGWYKVKLTVTDKQPHEFAYISAHQDYSKVIEGTINSTPSTDEGTGETGAENADG